jgi:hypothetical protein
LKEDSRSYDIFEPTSAVMVNRLPPSTLSQTIWFGDEGTIIRCFILISLKTPNTREGRGYRADFDTQSTDHTHHHRYTTPLHSLEDLPLITTVCLSVVPLQNPTPAHYPPPSAYNSSRGILTVYQEQNPFGIITLTHRTISPRRHFSGSILPLRPKTSK